MLQCMPANHSFTQIVLSPFYLVLIKRFFKKFSLSCYVAFLRVWRRRYFHGMNAMILMPQMFDVTANENARYKRNELECISMAGFKWDRNLIPMKFWISSWKMSFTFERSSMNKSNTKLSHKFMDGRSKYRVLLGRFTKSDSLKSDVDAHSH